MIILKVLNAKDSTTQMKCPPQQLKSPKEEMILKAKKEVIAESKLKS